MTARFSGSGRGAIHRSPAAASWTVLLRIITLGAVVGATINSAASDASGSAALIRSRSARKSKAKSQMARASWSSGTDPLATLIWTELRVCLQGSKR